MKLVKTERLYPLENHLGRRADEASFCWRNQCSGRAVRLFLTRHILAQAYLAFSIQADLRSAFSWNTKLLFVYLLAEYETPSNILNQVRLEYVLRYYRAVFLTIAFLARHQVSLWDRIIESQRDALFALPFVRNKYPLLDQARFAVF